MQLLQNILRFARDNPSSPAISTGGHSAMCLSYSEFTARVAALKERLLEEATQVDFVFVLAGRGPDLVSAVAASLFAGLPLAIIDPRMGHHRIAQLLGSVKSSYGLVDPLGQRILSSFAEDQLAGVDYAVMPLEGRQGLTGRKLTLNPVGTPDKSAAIILFTSGSTGVPKGVRISYDDLDRRLQTEQAWFDLSAEDRVLGVLPLSFDVGLTQFLGTLYSGGCHVLLNSWLPKDILAAIEQFDAHGLALSPVVWSNLLRFGDRDRLWQVINKLGYVTLSGGTLPLEELKLIAENLHSCSFIKTYGQTEMFRICSLKVRENPDKLHTVGKAYPGVEIEIRDDGGQLCAANQVGEVFARGNGTMLGYLGGQGSKPSEIRTGDYGMLDKDGYLYLKGRRDDMVKILDQRIYPDDVADSIRAITGLKEVVVLAEPIGGEIRLVVFFARQAGEIPAGDDWSPLLRQKLASHLIPSYLIGLDVLPHTPSGKIDKMALREHFRSSQRVESTDNV